MSIRVNQRSVLKITPPILLKYALLEDFLCTLSVHFISQKPNLISTVHTTIIMSHGVY